MKKNISISIKITVNIHDFNKKIVNLQFYICFKYFFYFVIVYFPVVERL